MSFMNSRTRLLCIVATLVGIGVVAVYSVSVGRVTRIEDSFRLLGKHVVWVAIGSMGLIAAMRIGYERLKPLKTVFLICALLLLVLVLVPGIGTVRNGARRWIRFGPMGFQPSEFAKLAIIIFMAGVISENRGRLERFWKGFLPPLLLIGLTFGLIMLEPDFGTAMVIATVGGVMLLVGGARLSHVFFVAMAALPGIVGLVIARPYRVKRVLAFLDPWEDPTGVGYHLVQSLVALGSGGLRGKGIGASHQKLFFLPESNTDFIFAIIGEEMGFVGCAFIILIFVLLIREGIRASVRAPDMFGSMLGFGITLVLGLQAALNIAVVTASVPPKGITLPFISFGGSALLFAMTAAGFLVDVAAAGDERARRQRMSMAAGQERYCTGEISSHV